MKQNCLKLKFNHKCVKIWISTHHVRQIHHCSQIKHRSRIQHRSQMRNHKKKILFENFDSLSEEQLSKLRSIDQSKSADSTFVLNSVRYFYSDNLEHLQGKSVKGSRLTQAMSPVRLDRMELLYKERTWHQLTLKNTNAKNNSIVTFIEQ